VYYCYSVLNFLWTLKGVFTSYKYIRNKGEKAWCLGKLILIKKKDVFVFWLLSLHVFFYLFFLNYSFMLFSFIFLFIMIMIWNHECQLKYRSVMISNIIDSTWDYFLMSRIVRMCLLTKMSKSHESHSFEMVLMDIWGYH